MANLEDLRIDSAVPRPRRRRRSPLPLALVVVAVAVALVFRFGGSLQQAGARIAPAKQVRVYTVPSAPAAPAGSFTAGGYLEVKPPGPTIVSSLIDGRIVELTVKPGDSVGAGDVVARLDGSLYQQDVAVQRGRVEMARASLSQQRAGFRTEEVDQARSRLREAQARQTQAEADFSRADLLLDEGVISRAEHDASRSALEQARARVSEAQSSLALLEAGQRPVDLAIYEAQVGAAQAELARAQTLLDKTVVRCPTSGVVLGQFVQPGGWVVRDTGEHPGGIISVMQPGQIQAWVDVNQRDIASVSVGQEVELVTDAFPDERIPGSVSQVMPSANLQKNTVQVKIAIPDPPAHLRPEMSVQITFKAPEEEGAEEQSTPVLLVPRLAVTTVDGKQAVYVISGGVAAVREVTTGGARGDQLEVLSGIGPGDQVVLEPAGVTAGAKVTAATDAPAAVPTETEGSTDDGS
jgi:HlyD family secretion protein